MRLLASRVRKRQMQTLYDWFNLEILTLDLEAIDGGLHVHLSTPSQELLRGMTIRVALPQSVAEFGIQVVSLRRFYCYKTEPKSDLPEQPAIVFNDSGAKHFFKPAYIEGPAKREMSILVRIQQLALSELLRVSTLHEMVQSEGDSSATSGMLLEYIEHDNTLAKVDINFARSGQMDQSTPRPGPKVTSFGNHLGRCKAG